MALFKVFRGQRNDLDSVTRVDGHAYFCTDDGSFWVDHQEGNVILRTQINKENWNEDIHNAVNNLNIQNGTGAGSIQSVPRADKVTQQDGEIAPCFSFTGHPDSDIGTRITYGAVGNYSASMNGRSAALNKHAFAINNSTVAKGEESFAQGYETIAEGNSSFAGGSRTWAKGAAAVALGDRTKAMAEYTTALGVCTTAGYAYQTVIGVANENVKESLFEVGNGEVDTDGNIITLSTAFRVMRNGKVKITDIWAKEDDDVVAKGFLDYTIEETSDFIFNEVNDLLNAQPLINKTANVGFNIITPTAVASGATYSIVLGANNGESVERASGIYDIVIGTGAQTLTSWTGIGPDVQTNAIAIGHGAIVGKIEGIAIGHSANVTAEGAISIGGFSYVSNTNAIAIGNGTRATGVDAIALGKGAVAQHTNAIAIGHSTASAEHTVAIGFNSVASAFGATAIGVNTKANSRYQTAIGIYNESKTNTLFEVGNGSADGRLNVFEVYTDGLVRAGRATVASDDSLVLVTKGYIDALEARIAALELQWKIVD